MASKPNSDIGLNPGDADYLRSQYPKIADAVIWDELVGAFKSHEDSAKAKKIASRRSSFWAIVSMVSSLSITLVATSPFFASPLDQVTWASPMLAIVALVLLVTSIALGKGIMYGRQRDDWLFHRLAGERLRQLYFQFILMRMTDICAKGSLGQQGVVRSRNKVLESVLKRITAPVYIQSVKNDGTLEEAALVDRPALSADAEIDIEKLRELRRFWREFRFDWQVNYATEQAGRRASPFPIFGSLADQEHTVSSLEYVATIGIVALQCVAVFAQMAQFFDMPNNYTAANSVLVASVLAVAVVGLQAYRDGMGLTEDLTRNRVYASYAAKLCRDFVVACQDEDLTAQARVMTEMEDLAYFETREFLHNHSNARFSL